jgi:hypothetical protein
MGRPPKGVKFQGNVDIGDPVEMAKDYYQQGVDELVFYDITASAEKGDYAGGRTQGRQGDLYPVLCRGRHRLRRGYPQGDPSWGGKGEPQFPGCQ